MSSERFLYNAVLANPKQPILRDRKLGGEAHYVITLWPGAVKYLYFAEFFGADVEEVILEIQGSSETAMVERVFAEMRHPDFETGFHVRFSPGPLDMILDRLAWPDKLRVHHALGRLMIEEMMPSDVYLGFHRLLRLGLNFAIAECVEAWVRESVRNPDIAASYRTSSQHIVLKDDWEMPLVVFRKTAFVQKRLDELDAQESRQKEEAARQAEKQRAEIEALHTKELAERLRRSQFTTFVYIMEDTRNGIFKIGRSNTPGKRERTLQSEVPEIILRLSIPAAEEHEKALHTRFKHRRVRGEWFHLSTNEIIDAVAFLRSEGDAERADGDFKWLGLMFIRAGESS